jgi:ABC-2 type transport system ATP-binding protein
MTAVLEARGLGKKYRRRWALADCTLTIPAGRVAGLVGPNGAGKTTLLQLAAGLLQPSAGTIEVLGSRPASSPAQRGRVSFVAQDAPTYAHLSVADHLRLGAHLNPVWDGQFAGDRIGALGLDPGQKAGKLSGGQRAQLALTLALARRPELLLLDEPVASLDPLARREFLRQLSDTADDEGLSIVLSSHLIADVERVCDYLIVLAGSRVQVAGEVGQLLSAHVRLTGPRRDLAALPASWQIVSASHDGPETTLILAAGTGIRDPAWAAGQPTLEDVVLAYMSRAEAATPGSVSELEVTA